MRTRGLLLALWVGLAVALMGSRCGEAVTPEELREDVAPAFDYGLYSDAHGRLEGERAAVLLVHRGEHLERVYADAQGNNARAQVLFGQLEQASTAAGAGLADQALSLTCTALPTCTVKWANLEELIPSTGPGGVRLRQSLVRGFEAQARRKHMENALLTAALDALVVGGAAMAVEAAVAPGEMKAGAGEARVLEREAIAEARGALAGMEGPLTEEEAAALEARWEEAEAQEEGRRQPARLDVLARLRPALNEPPPGVVAQNPTWAKYVAYWEKRYEELAGVRPRAAGLSAAKPPLEWSGYTVFQGRVRRALEFQAKVGRTLRQQAQLPEAERTWMMKMERPRVDENVGLAHGLERALTYVDQLVVDEATLRPGSTPVVHSFSNKQRDFNVMSRRQVQDCVSSDVEEAMSKYGGLVEVRRPGHPLFGRKMSVSNVHLVYDGQLTSAPTQEMIKLEVGRSHVELHFHTP